MINHKDQSRLNVLILIQVSGLFMLIQSIPVWKMFGYGWSLSYTGQPAQVCRAAFGFVQAETSRMQNVFCP